MADRRSDAGTIGGAAGATASGAAIGTVRLWLRIEGLAALAAGVAAYLTWGGQLLWLVPLLLAVDVSMAGYLAGPRPGAIVYNLAHNWAIGLAALGLGWAAAATPLILAGAILVAHVGFDRLAGYGLKYPTAFGDTHLGWIGRRPGSHAIEEK
jgi:Domain of unknown function (DUF4260)